MFMGSLKWGLFLGLFLSDPFEPCPASEHRLAPGPVVVMVMEEGPEGVLVVVLVAVLTT